MKGIKKMKKAINVMLAGLLFIPMLALAVSAVAPVQVSAADPVACNSKDLTVQNGADCSGGQSGTPNQLFGDGSIFQNITNAALFLIGAISVIMLIYGGIRYTISGGDTKNVTDAKNTILYAVVGIVVAIMAYAIVNFVIGKLVTP